MNAQTSSTPNGPQQPYNGLQGLGAGITREAEALDASLDRAFSALREIRTSTNRLVAQASDTAVVEATSATVPDEYVHHIVTTLQAVAGQIYKSLDDTGAPPDVDSAARRTADGLGVVAEELSAELSSWGETGAMPPDTVARLLTECRSEAQGLQRRISGPVGKLMCIMQLRDNMDQRSAHIMAGAGLGLEADGPSKLLVEMCLAAQLRDISESVREGGSSVAEAITSIDQLTSGLRTQIGMVLGRTILPKTSYVLEQALAGRADWVAFKPLSEPADQLDDFFRNGWTELMVMLSYDWANQHVACEGASKVADILDVTASMLAAGQTMDEQAQEMAESAVRLDALSDSLAQETGAQVTSEVRDDPGLNALWNHYTVDAERDVHNKLVERLAS